jgi:hypothetical protein
MILYLGLADSVAVRVFSYPIMILQMVAAGTMTMQLELRTSLIV